MSCAPVPYATITHLRGRDDQRAEVFTSALEPAPGGLMANLVGRGDDGVWIVEVWASQAEHDRFVTERLHPALRRSGQRLGDPVTHIAIAVDRLYLWTEAT